MNNKTELTRFFTWLRNGICFTVTWFLILELITKSVAGVETLYVSRLIKTILWTSGGVLVFCIIFTNLIIKKLGFTARLTIFMTALTVYEVAYFYSIGIFTHAGCIYQWALFFLIILPLYFICLAIYMLYRKKKGELYTFALQKYQQERKTENE